MQVAAALGLAGMILLLSILMGKRSSVRKPADIPYECGMIPMGEGAPMFSVKFYMVAMLTGGTVKIRLPSCQTVQRQQSLPWGRPAFHIPGTSFLRGSVFQGILRQTSVYHKTPLSGFNTQNPGRMQPSTSAFGNEPATTAAGNGPAIRKLSPHGKRTGIPFIAGNNGLTPPSNGKSTFRPLPSE